MKMVDYFVGGRFDLRVLSRCEWITKAGDLDVSVETVNASIVVPDLAIACSVAEFILNVIPMPRPPKWQDLERYVERPSTSLAGYSFSCDQDFLR